MKLFSLIAIGLSVMLLSGCAKKPKNATYYTYYKDLAGLKRFHQSGGNLNAGTPNGDFFNGNALCASVLESIDYGNQLAFYQKNRPIMQYLLENGIKTHNVRCKPSFYDDRVFDLFNLSLMTKDKVIIKQLIDHDVTIHNFDLPHIRMSFGGTIWNNDSSTSCGLQQHICDNQKFAKEYFRQVQSRKRRAEQETVEKKKNDKVDELLGL